MTFRCNVLYWFSNCKRFIVESARTIKISVEIGHSWSNNVPPERRTNSARSWRVKTRWNDLQSIANEINEENSGFSGDCRAKCIVDMLESPWISNGVSSSSSFSIKHRSIHRIETMNKCRATAWKIFFENMHRFGVSESSMIRCVVEEFTVKLFDSDAHEEKCLINKSSWC